MNDSTQPGCDDAMDLCRRYGVIDFESEVLAMRILTRCSLARIEAALDSPDRRGRWKTLEYLDRYLDELTAMVEEPAEKSWSPKSPSGLAAAIAEDPALWQAYCQHQRENVDRIQAEARLRFGRHRRARFAGIEIRRQAA